MRKSTLTYSLLVFLGGASYGIMATTVKLAYSEGFTWQQAVAAQGSGGVFFFVIAFLLVTLFGNKPEKMGLKQVLKLVGTGAAGCSTSILYGYALTMLPVSVAITLLFQFTWIGIVFQVIVTRRRPTSAEIAAGIILFFGTLMASGLFSGGMHPDLNPIGILCASLSAVTYTVFLFLSGKVETTMPWMQRGLFICIGSALVGQTICPDFFPSGILLEGLWKYVLILGAFGLFIPVVLFGIGTPHLPTGISTIMASSELPAAVLMSVFVLQEPIDVLQVFGIVIILGGVIISQLPTLRLLMRAAKRNVI